MTEKELHERMEALEKRLGASRSELSRLTQQQRMDIGEALASLSKALGDHEERLHDKR